MLALTASILSIVTCAPGLPGVLGVDGRLHHPLDEAHGKPVAFIFVCHDCPVCNTYAPEIGRIEIAYHGKIEFAIVYSEPRLSRDQASRHAKEFGIDRATLLLDADSGFAAACSAKMTPEAVIFDSTGKRLYAGRIDDKYYAIGRQRPAATVHDLTAALDSVLLHRIPKPPSGPPYGCIISYPTKT